MIALPLNSLAVSFLTHRHLSSSKTHFHYPTSCPEISSSFLQSVKLRNETAKSRSKSNGPFENDPRFIMDENGVVDDMEDYLNSLSLEYDSVWDTKPSWCQPWTIALTGVSVIACSWLVLHSIVVTVLASSLIFAWWYILFLNPKAYTEMIAERRKRVKSGTEDTYGWSKNQ